MEELVLHCTVTAYEHLEIASVVSETKYRRLKESCICVCTIDDYGKWNLTWVLYFVKIFTGECVKLGDLGYKDVKGEFSVIGSGLHRD